MPMKVWSEGAHLAILEKYYLHPANIYLSGVGLVKGPY